MKYTRNAVLAVVFALSTSAPLSAQIVSNPASISNSSDGTYITDAVNKLDWYKFSNFNNTIGMSYNDVVASANFAGWSVASLAQVQGLQTQFGWISDTPGLGSSVNYGLTDAMAGFLGLTGTFYVDGIRGNYDKTSTIEAMTSEAFYYGPDGDIVYYGVTTSNTFEEKDATGSFYTGDRVDGTYDWQLSDEENGSRGTWLVRASNPDNPTCGQRDCTTVTPEPASFALLATGLIALGGMTRRKRKNES